MYNPIFNQNTQQAWQEYIATLEQTLTDTNSNNWLTNLKLISYTKDKVILGGVTSFFKNLIYKQYFTLFRDAFYTAFQTLGLEENYTLEITSQAIILQEDKKTLQPKKTSHLNPSFNFSNFINGANSDMAYAASYATAENVENSKYNPLFICGDVGLGKTHLIQAIGNHVANKNMTTLYTSSKQFTHEIIDNIRFGNMQSVRDAYSQVDMLLIDDIQFIENKERTQEEFFYIFNQLIQNKKQIVLTADRYPREIQNLQERLINRFNSGMVCRIYPPDYETRIAIILSKIEKIGVALSTELVQYIAKHVKYNVRDLEGVLIHIEARFSLLGQQITIQIVKQILEEVLNLKDKTHNTEDIIKYICQEYDIKVTDVKSTKRDKNISITRQLCMYIVRELTNDSYPVIGKYFGGKNHTSVMQACKKTQERIDQDPEFKQRVQTLIQNLNKIMHK